MSFSSVSLLINTLQSTKPAAKAVILHIHGGGYVGGHPDSFLPFADFMTRDLGIPVLLPSYRKAPDQPFPAALQDCLDFYGFLFSGGELVRRLIGFHPEAVILSGDSAGGNFALSLTLAVMQIRRMRAAEAGDSSRRSKEIKMPAALLLQYPCLCPAFVSLPSYVLSPIDLIASTGALFSFMSAYHPDWSASPEAGQALWFRQEPEERVKGLIASLAARSRDPLFNNLAFEGFADEEIKAIDLRITAAEMDPLLDHSVSLARRWRGSEVDLRIAERMPHCFAILPRLPPLTPASSLIRAQFALAFGRVNKRLEK